MAIPVWTVGQVLTASDVNSWFVPTAFKQKASAESVTSSTAFQNDDDLFFTGAVNSVYKVEYVLSVDGATTGDIKLQLTGPAGGDCLLIAHGLQSGATVGGAEDQIQLLEGFGTSTVFGTLGAADHRPIHMVGTVTIAGTGGTVNLQWAQNASNATATRILGGSSLEVRKVS